MSFLSRAFQREAPQEARDITGLNSVPTPYEDAMLMGTGVVPGGNAMALGAFYACVTLLADTIASLSIKAYRQDSSARVLVNPQPRLLVDSPYPETTWFSWLWMFMESLAVTGNGFGYVTARGEDDRPTAIMPVHPDALQIELPMGQEPQWPDPIYRIGGRRFPNNDIVHIRRYPIAGCVLGMSPIEKAASAVGLGLAAERYGLRYFRDSANPSGLLTTDQDLTSEQAKRNQKQWISSHQGRRLPAIMSGGLKWQTVSITPEESQFLECVVPGTLFTMADGTRRVAESLRAGDVVMAWNGSKLEGARVAATGTPPIKPLVRITTARGRTLTATADHPVLGLRALRTPGGRPLSAEGDWIAMGDLKPGHYVRVALGDLPSGRGVETLSDNAAYFLGAMVGDGYIRSGSCSWSSIDLGVTARMGTAVGSLGGALQHRSGCDFTILTGGTGTGSTIRSLLNDSGLVGSHSHTKRVPEMVLRGGRGAWCRFLGGYFDADGSIRDRAGKQKPAAYWSSTSRGLLEDCQHLLALLGINSSIYSMCNADKAVIEGVPCNAHPQWGLYVMGLSELGKLAREISVSHTEKRRRLADYADAPPSRYRPVNFDYDRIKTVEHFGPGETVGVEIEGLHTHITAGLITHNTRQYQRSEIAMWFRIPPHMIGDQEKSTSWGSGIEQMSIAFVTYTLRPWLTCIEQIVTRMLPRGQFASFNIDGLLRGDVKTRWEAYRLGRESGVYSVNDIRAFENLPPVSDGDGRIQPLNFGPLGAEPPDQPTQPNNPATNNDGADQENNDTSP